MKIETKQTIVIELDVYTAREISQELSDILPNLEGTDLDPETLQKFHNLLYNEIG